MQRMGEQAALGVVEREPGFVARAFDAENEHSVGANAAGFGPSPQKWRVKNVKVYQ
jgi:hypothetical protein